MKDIDNYQIYQEKYDKPDAYNYLSGGTRWQLYLIRSILKNIDSNVSSILDVGCGSGVKTELLSQIFPQAQVTGIDFSDKGISVASKRKNANAKYVCGDVEKLWWDTTYDLVASFQVLEHIQKWENMLEKICCLSNKYVLVTVPTGRMRKYEVFDGHYRNYQKGQIESFMQRKGYKMIKGYYAGFPFYSPIERDVMCVFYKKHDNSTKHFSYSKATKLMHDAVYMLYRLNSKHIGDQFLGLFQKEEN